MVRVMRVGVLVAALALALASLALIATAESARADDEGCYWLNMEGISEQTATMPSTAPVAALWARWAVRREASEAPTRVVSGRWRALSSSYQEL